MLRGIPSFIREQENRRTLGYYSIFISLGMNLAVIGTVLPALADQTSTRLGLMGTLFLVSSIGYVFGTVAGGRVLIRHLVTDLVRQTMWRCSIASSIDTYLSASTDSFWCQRDCRWNAEHRYKYFTALDSWR